MCAKILYTSQSQKYFHCHYDCILSVWTRVLILALPPQAVPLDHHVTSLNLSCVMGKISDRQCASFQFLHSVILPQVTFLLKASGKPGPCSQSESRYSWTHICLVSTIQGRCLVISACALTVDQGKEKAHGTMSLAFSLLSHMIWITAWPILWIIKKHLMLT